MVPTVLRALSLQVAVDAWTLDDINHVSVGGSGMIRPARACALRNAFSSMPLVPSRRSSSAARRRRQAVVGQRHHAVKPQVGHLTHDFGLVAAVVNVLGGHHDLGGLFADFLQEGVRPLCAAGGPRNWLSGSPPLQGLRLSITAGQLRPGGRGDKDVIGHGTYL
jgi:hypothetical protein